MSVGVPHLGRHFSKVTEAPGNPTLPIPYTLPGNSFILMMKIWELIYLDDEDGSRDSCITQQRKRPMTGRLTSQKLILFCFVLFFSLLG